MRSTHVDTWVHCFICACRVPARSVVVNAAEHRGGRRQGPRLPSRRREARHLPRLQDIQHPAQPRK